MKTYRVPSTVVMLFTILTGIATSIDGLAATLVVQLDGGFTNQIYYIDYTDGSYDMVNVSATVALAFDPSTPVYNVTNFTSSTAVVTGSLHVWGSAAHYDPNPNNSAGFDNTYSYNGTSVSAPTTYEGKTGQGGVQTLTWPVGLPRSQNNAVPYYLQYTGSSGLLELWISLPAPFQYSTNEEYYIGTGTTAVSGQSSVYSDLNGTVTGASSGQPVSAAQVSFGNVPATTSSAGTFFYGNIPANTYQLIVTKSGYLPYTNLVTVPPFTILQQPVVLGQGQLSVLDGNAQFLGSVFAEGTTFPLDPTSPNTPTALAALAAAATTRVGLVADATNNLLFRFVADVPGSVTFAQSNIFAGTLSGVGGPLSGEPIPLALYNGKYMAFAIYQAPDSIADPQIIDIIQASFTPTGAASPVETSALIKVNRNPVLLVHGLWSGPSAWTPLEPQLSNDGFLWSAVDYSTFLGAAGSFSLYRGTVWAAASQLLTQAQNYGFAATRVDVVAHSMGGILTRIDAADPYNAQGCFRRLITIDTPHFGTRAATVLLGLAQSSPWFASKLNEDGQHPIDLGAINDLDPRTFAESIKVPGSSVLLSNTTLPSFAITCTVSSQQDLPPKGEFLVYLLAKACSLPLPQTIQEQIYCDQTIELGDQEITVANKVFDTMTHDAIVPQPSQAGGCLASLNFPDVAHTVAPQNTSVMDKVILLLTGPVSAFSSGGFPTVTTSTVEPQLCGTGYTGPPVLNAGTLIVATLLPNLPNINTPFPLKPPVPHPLALTVTQPGASVSLTVQTLPGDSVSDLILTASQNGAVIATEESTNLPVTFSFTVPTNSLGNITIDAVAVNSLGQFDEESTNLTVQTGSGTDLQSLAVSPTAFTFSGIGQAGQLAVTGNFSDGSTLDLTDSGSGTSYSTSVPGVVSVDTNGLITALAQGTGTITVGFGAITTNLPVTVSLAQPALLSTTPVSSSPGSSSVPFTLIGSALGGATSVQFFLNGNLDSSLSASNLTVGAAGLNLTGTLSIMTNALPGLRTVVVTTPGGSSSKNVAAGNRFFVGNPMQLSSFQIMSSSPNTPWITLHVVGSPGGTCVLQTSTNLFTWSPIATNTLSGGDWYFAKYLVAGQKSLFYRAFLPGN